MQLSSQQYVVLHLRYDISGVSLANVDSQVSQSYACQSGCDVTELNWPSHVTADRDNFVFVADRLNNRVVLLSPGLELVRHVELEHEPRRLYLDQVVTRRLYVGHVLGGIVVIQV